VIEGLESGSLRKFLGTLASGLHQNDETPPRSLGSRNLLQRATLVAVLIEKFCPDVSELPGLVKQAEGKAKNGDPDLQAELVRYHKFVRDEFAPLAFLYDLRTYGRFLYPVEADHAANSFLPRSFIEEALGPEHDMFRTPPELKPYLSGGRTRGEMGSANNIHHRRDLVPAGHSRSQCLRPGRAQSAHAHAR
jgi:hypothetical protein